MQAGGVSVVSQQKRPAPLQIFVFLLIVIQPLMDVLSFWMDSMGAGNLGTLLLRLCVLLCTVLTGFFLSRKKALWLCLFAVLLLHAGGHAVGCFQSGYDAPAADLTNLVRIYQLPLTVFAFVSFFRREEGCLRVVAPAFAVNLAVIALVELLATLTGTDPHTYANKAIGVLGWFSTTNAQSAIISMLVPTVLAWFAGKKRPLWLAGACLSCFSLLFLFATRLAYASLVGCAFAMAVGCLIIGRLQKTSMVPIAAVFAAFGLAALLFYGISPMRQNSLRMAENAILKQQDIDALIAADEKAAAEDGRELARLKSAYEKYLPRVTARFGLEAAAEEYGYSTSVSDIANARWEKLTYCRLLLREQPGCSLFGVERQDLIHGELISDPENDFHSIRYLCGWVGLGLLLAFLLAFLLRILRGLRARFSTVFTLPALGCGISLLCGLAHAYFTESVLRRPNSNFYLAVLLAVAFMLTAHTEKRRIPMPLIKKYRALLQGRLPLATLILFVLQPLMDVLSFWVLKWGMGNTVTLLLRLFVLAAMVLTGYLVADRKKPWHITAAVCAFIGICHMIACFHFGYGNIVTDLSNYVRVLQLPLTVLCLITFMQKDAGCYKAMMGGIALNLTIILAVQILAVLTGTEPHTYTDGAGYIGWFTNTNTQSAILTTIAPVAVCWLCRRKGLRSPWLWIVLLGSGFSMFFLGTRLAYAGIIATTFGLAASTLIIRVKDWKQALSFLLAGVLFIAILPYAPMMGHRKAHSDEMELKQGWVNVALTKPKDEKEEDEKEDPGPPPLAGEPLELTEEQRARIQYLTPIYEHYVPDLIAVFGVERTIHMMGYTEDIVAMTNTRSKKLLFAEAVMDLSPVTARLFGIELSRFTVRGHIFDVENDFHGIYYLYGILGLAALLAYLVYFIAIIAIALLKNFRRTFTLEAAAWGIALIMSLGHCYFTAGVLRRPNAAFYLAAVLAGAYYLVKIKQTPAKTEA